MKTGIALVLFVWVAGVHITAQSLTLPPSGDNPKSIVTQYFGNVAQVSVLYNSVDVTSPTGEDRTGKIWGQLVPYGLTDPGFGLGNPSPWRAGANENTVIKFSEDVLVEGQPLEAGKYGLHLIVNETGPWTWIFSRNHTAWGSFFYDENDDALRVDVQPQEAPFHEWLSFEFIERDPSRLTLAMFWENKMAPMVIELPNLQELYVEGFRKGLQGSAGFNYQNFQSAANYCATNDYNLEEALNWADQAMNSPFFGQKNFSTMQTKSTVLMKLGRSDEATALMMEAIRDPSATPFQIHGFGRQLISMGMTDNAMQVFQYNYDHHKGTWPTNVGMARGLSALGKYNEALPYAEKAYAEAPDTLNKSNLESVIGKLKQGQDIN